MSLRILIANGPNLNLLGLREPEIYGRETLDDIRAACIRTGEELGVEIDFRQTNHEGWLVTWIQEARTTADAIILNAGAFTHTSAAIHDALRTYDGFKLELHLSNPHKREVFRHLTFLGPASDAVIAGFGAAGYAAAVRAVAGRLEGGA
ncbi:MAG: type II 3-dehydroquinate dehydratase [Paracoccaceae bacterium]